MGTKFQLEALDRNVRFAPEADLRVSPISPSRGRFLYLLSPYHSRKLFPMMVTAANIPAIPPSLTTRRNLPSVHIIKGMVGIGVVSGTAAFGRLDDGSAVDDEIKILSLQSP